MPSKARRRIFVATGAIAIGLWIWSGPHVWWSPKFSFRLVDATSKDAIAGAIVVATWEARQYESSFARTLSIQESISDANGVVVFKSWGPRLVLIGGVMGTEPIVRIAHRQYQPKALRSEIGPQWARMKIPVPWAGTNVLLERSPPHGSGEYWNSAASLFSSLRSQLEGCGWKKFPKMTEFLKGLQNEYAVNTAAAPGLSILSGIGSDQGCGESE